MWKKYFESAKGATWNRCSHPTATDKKGHYCFFFNFLRLFLFFFISPLCNPFYLPFIIQFLPYFNKQCDLKKACCSRPCGIETQNIYDFN
ncbi:unnamed protein product [Rotaria socialis]